MNEGVCVAVTGNCCSNVFVLVKNLDRNRRQKTKTKDKTVPTQYDSAPRSRTLCNQIPFISEETGKDRIILVLKVVVKAVLLQMHIKELFASGLRPPWPSIRPRAKHWTGSGSLTRTLVQLWSIVRSLFARIVSKFGSWTETNREKLRSGQWRTMSCMERCFNIKQCVIFIYTV